MDAAEFDAMVADMVKRHAAHKITRTYAARSYRHNGVIALSCTCGWTGSPGKNPDAVVDAHLVAAMLPDWPTGVCTVDGRMAMRAPTGVWFHVEFYTQPHRPRLREDGTR